MNALRWLRNGGPYMGVVGKVVAGGIFLACFVLGSLVGLMLGSASVGGNFGAIVGLLIIALNVLRSVLYMRRRFDPAKARAEGERRAEARLRARDENVYGPLATWPTDDFLRASRSASRDQARESFCGSKQTRPCLSQ